VDLKTEPYILYWHFSILPYSRYDRWL